jgi:glucuronate isomerase
MGKRKNNHKRCNMKTFMNEDFLLSNDVAKKLYNDYAKDMPIIDFHCHLDPKEIWEDRKFKNITDVWLGGDHYKWRAMRSNGVEEKYVTGDGEDYKKFVAWAGTLTNAIGNPLYHWTHLELQRYFNIYDVLNEKNAEAIWNKANKLIESEDFTVRNLIKRSKVKVICTTDDAASNLEYHIKLKDCKDFDTKVLPTLRPDKALNIAAKGFNDYIKQLAEVWGKEIRVYEDLLICLEDRVKFFNENGCRLSDHGLDYVPYSEASLEEIKDIFDRALRGENISIEEEEKFKTCTLIYMGHLYHKYNWSMQLHMGALRNNNTRMIKQIGPDTGFDSVNDVNIAYKLSRLLDSMEMNGKLPKTVLYNLNPADNYVLGTMIGNFQGGGVPGKIQYGAAWWFLDNKEGMEIQMRALANLGLVGRFIGMLTDSRSFLSYTRHEYFRRILCNMLGLWVESGEVPEDIEMLGSIVENICYHNSNEYFGFGLTI